MFSTDNLRGPESDHPLAPSWVKARVVLGLMARWKALYILRGYDKSWYILQNLRILARQPPDPEPILPDGTKANGNWSVRELATIEPLNQIIQTVAPQGTVVLGGIPVNVVVESDGISLNNLMLALDVIARGNWDGLATHESGLSRPVNFRDRLAAAAL